MKKVEFKDAKPYQPPRHSNIAAMRLQGKEETGTQKFWMAVSHYLPGAKSEYDDAPLERVYFVLDGEITIKTPEEEIILRAWDSIYFAPNEGREVFNRTNKPASILLVIGYPD